jgi:hypothetical protein
MHAPARRPSFHRFGSSLNLHTHSHVHIIDRVFEPDAQGDASTPSTNWMRKT